MSKVKYFFLSIFSVIVISGCNQNFGFNAPSLKGKDPSVGGTVQKTLSVEAFSTTLHPILKNNCAGCHGIFQQPKFAVSNAEQSHDTLLSNSLINTKVPNASAIVAKIAGGHNGFSTPMSNTILSQIQAWVAKTGEIPDIGDTTPEIPVEDFEVANKLSIASKIKFLSHGGPLTAEELGALNGTSNNSQLNSYLSSRIDDWMSSDEFQKKLHRFLFVSLQQDGAAVNNRDTWPLLGTVNEVNTCPKMASNLREMFVKTSLNIINANQPFNQIVKTRRWMVTTASLVMLAWMDNDRLGLSHGTNRAFTHSQQIGLKACPNLTDADYEDWREVVFTTASNNDSPRSYEDIAGWRSVTDGQTISFAVPRIGFFTTPMFLRKWISNEDNQFRLTVNQALIGALNQTFSLADQTQPMRALSSSDAVHSVPGTACFHCHKTMDPMRDLFRGALNVRSYRYYPRPDEFVDPVFAFRGVRQSIPTIESFADVLATHPDFSTGWVQKLCQYFNSQSCSDSDPEFIRIANEFKNSGLNFKALYKSLLLSPMVTGASATKTSNEKGFHVSIVRKSHLCHSLNVRVRAFEVANSKPPAALDGGHLICSGSKPRQLISGAITEDVLPRGSTVLAQSLTPSPFYVHASQDLCWYISDYFVKQGYLPSMTYGAPPDAEIRKTIADIATYFVGVPEGHPRRDKILGSLNNVYDYSYANRVGALDRDIRLPALKDVFAFGCSLPEVLAAGL